MHWLVRQNMPMIIIFSRKICGAIVLPSAQIYDAYVKRCFKNGAMDFDDLLLKMYELLKNFPEVIAANTSISSNIF